MLTYLVIEIRIIGEVREVYIKISDYVARITFLTPIPRLWAYAGRYFGTSEQCHYYKHCNGTSNTPALEKVYTLTLMIKSILIQTSAFNQF
jgi:hypothetical protein